jgi:DNA repair protein RadC
MTLMGDVKITIEGSGACAHSHPASVPTLPCTKCGYAAPAAPGEAPAAGEQNGPVIDTAADVYALVAKDLQTEAQEHALLVLLDVHRRVLAAPDGVVLLAKGSAVETLVPIEAIVREVCTRNARSFCLIHSHPSGLAKPSKADRALTKQVEAAFSKKTGLDVVFIDHVVIGKSQWFSFAEGKRFTV